MITLRHALAIATALITFAGPAYAQQWYQVEVVVFEQLNANTDEAWPTMPVGNTTDLTPRSATNRIQPAQRGELSGIAERLRNSAGYRVLSHEAWQQSALGRNASQPVQIEGERLTGKIHIYKSAYLHSVLDLWLTSGSTTFEAQQYPNLNESRRIRSQELHYFDHPRFGAILQLKPIATPDNVLNAMQGGESYSLPD
ncbi:Protein of unknown function (DUF2803) [Methylophaga frappieri]|uniref:Peptidoglycan-binding protein CsiV n=1 Tax=Methylophaga frappieri (strain ATCC BAA-2434 / DSM 25690 / JAM7) TaxID=754477 RepID=I1YFW3_METFJ|nr:CsiV family protein [Methylophaga frappieri]AFJ01806.1 Protein of unknown function (DUF2803) [Methylophaga frappieri]